MAETAGYLRFCPYEPYDHQRDAMERIYDALEAERDVLFEGACGTGKTLASLVPALDYAREAGKTVVITTNVHQQTRQFIEEARAITSEEPLRAVVFRGKGDMCHVDVDYQTCQALRDTTRELVDTEREKAELEDRQEELLEESQGGDREAADARGAVMDELDSLEEGVDSFEDENVCEHYYRNLTADTDDFYAWLYDDVRTPEEIFERAGRDGFCGYELLKEGMEGVDLVVCNYHHLLDPMIREQFFRWVGRDPEDVITIFDEAHNIEGAARDHATRTLTENTIESALDELDEADDFRTGAARNVVATFRDALVATYDEKLGYGTRESVEEEWHDLTIDEGSGRDDLTMRFLEEYTGPGFREELEQASNLGAELDRKYEEAYKNGETTTRKECQLQQVAAFVETWFDHGADPGQYPVVSVRRAEDTGDLYGRAELYTCIPRDVTADLFSELHASVLMSATLRPFDVTENVLGMSDVETMAYGPQFPDDHRRTYAVEAPALFASKRNDPEVQDVVGETLADAARFTAGNTLAFFPSYAEADRYAERLRGELDSTIYHDEPGTSAQELKERFVADDDAILFTSLWGTLTEGVSFDGDDARTVVVVGVPYPHLDDRMDAVQSAYDGAFEGQDAGWRYGVEVPTIRKTRQAIGRVVRSPADFGARILVDERYTRRAAREMPKYSVRDAFPEEERGETIDIAPEKLKFALLNFYSDMDAWDGEPPQP